MCCLTCILWHIQNFAHNLTTSCHYFTVCAFFFLHIRFLQSKTFFHLLPEERLISLLDKNKTKQKKKTIHIIYFLIFSSTSALVLSGGNFSSGLVTLTLFQLEFRGFVSVSPLFFQKLSVGLRCVSVVFRLDMYEKPTSESDWLNDQQL